MSPQGLANFFALIVAGGALGLVITGLRPALRPSVSESALPLIAIVAVGATAASLYFSEIAHYAPCELCWFQRIAMYPGALLLPLAALRRDRGVFPYALLLALAGLVVSIYHIQLQAFPDQSSFCELANPCTDSPVKAFDAVTIPQMTAACFTFIAIISAIALRTPVVRREKEQLQ